MIDYVWVFMVAVCLFGRDFPGRFRDLITNQVTFNFPYNNVRAFPFKGQIAIYTYFLWHRTVMLYPSFSF